jgi:hypothetical protein
MSARPPHLACIRLRLREIGQLFNSMDPSPFIDRDLDADAEEFIVSWAREYPKGNEFELAIHLTTPPTSTPANIEESIRHYFKQRAEMKTREFSQLLKRGRLSLVVGLLFLTGCLVLSEVIGKLGHGTAAGIVEESLTIGGWVAMWRPLEIYLYNWWPVLAERNLLERLARVRVTLVLP